MSARGGIPRQGSSADDLRGQMSRGLGDANLQDDALSLGRVRQGERVGKTEARRAVVKLETGIDEYRVTFPRMKRVPGLARVEGSENMLGVSSDYAVEWIRREKWTTTTAWVRVTATRGQLAGGRVYLEIGGTQ